MKRIIIIIAKMLLFMLLLFALMRMVFLVNYWHLVSFNNIPLTEILKSFWIALPLDISTACYLLLIPILVLIVGVIINKNASFRYLRWYFYLIIAVYVLIVMGETGIYGEWQTKLSYKALAYLKNPAEVVNSASTGMAVLLISLWAIFTILFSWWYVRWIEPQKRSRNTKKDNPLTYFFGAVIILALTFLGMRGGWSEIPISTSKGYFSKHKLINVMTVNPAYNLFENTLNSKKVETQAHFNYMDNVTAKNRTESIHIVDCDSTRSILKIQNPNIIVILLESWSADLIESLGGEPDITPNFHELEKDGLLFTNFYASANRSQQAIASLFGGLPGLPVTTITNHPDKYYAIPSLVKSMESLGYFTSFYFGGELSYGNILSYLRYNEFDLVVEGKDINERFTRGKLGVQDVDMMSWFANDLSKHKSPFFSTLFTISTHSPYDYPKIFDEITWPKLEKQFVNSAHYTDIALKLFMDEAREKSWYDSTIFIFMADHSHPSYKNHRMESFDYHKIPMLIYGKPLLDSLRGTTFDTICGNTDFPATLLAQLGKKHDEFIWSKDVFNYCYRPFAFFELNDGVGWKTPQGEFVISGDYGFIKNNIPPEMNDSIVMDGKAYMQHHYDLFNKY